MISWAEGMGLRRNDIAVTGRLPDSALIPGDIVLLNHTSAARPVANGRLVHPARFVALPSIAYRLARVAVGDAQATGSLSGPVSYDYAAGHGLLLGAGGVLLDEAGQEVTYQLDGSGSVSACFGGSPKAARDLAERHWNQARSETAVGRRVALTWPRLPEYLGLDRAIGCLFGQVIGDSLGSLVEFESARQIEASYPAGVRDLADGGTFDTIAGQPTDDSELALALARVLAAGHCYDVEAVANAYVRWVESRPFDIGTTTLQALGAARLARSGRAEAARQAANPQSQANGALMRISSVGIAAPTARAAAEMAMDDARLTHPHPACLNANAAFAAAIWTGVAGGTPAEMLDAATAYAGLALDENLISYTLRDARDGIAPANDLGKQGWVRIAFGNAFARLARLQAPETALIETVGLGGDTDTNAAIAGALLGAAWGRDAFPTRWRMPVLACRPHQALCARRARAMDYWPDDLTELVDRT